MGKKFGNMTKEEAREAGRKGGIASGEAKRRKKAMRETLEILLSMNLRKGKAADIESIKSFTDLKGKNVTIEQAMLIAQLQKALKGDTTAFTVLRDTSGQKPVDSVDVSIAVPVFNGEDELED